MKEVVLDVLEIAALVFATVAIVMGLGTKQHESVIEGMLLFQTIVLVDIKRQVSDK